MSNRLFQSVVHQMRDTIDCVIGVIDENATIIACSELSQVGTTNEFVSLDLGDSHDIFVRDGYTYKPFGAHMKPDYAVFVEGTDEVAAKYASILAITLSSIKQYYDEKYDRNNFIKNVVLDNVLPGDVHVKARELHFSADVSEGDRITKGQTLLTFDMDFIKSKGYQTITPVLVGNSDEFASVEELAEEGTEVTIGDKLIKVNA